MQTRGRRQGEEGGRRPRKKRTAQGPEAGQGPMEGLRSWPAVGGWVDVWLERSVQGEGDQG